MSPPGVELSPTIAEPSALTAYANEYELPLTLVPMLPRPSHTPDGAFGVISHRQACAALPMRMRPTMIEPSALTAVHRGRLPPSGKVKAWSPPACVHR